MLFAPKKFTDKEELLQAYYDYLENRDPSRTCYLSGPISPANGKSISENIGNLKYYARKLDAAGEYDTVINPSSAGDLERMGYTGEDALWVWLGLLKSGLVKIIAMVPGWERSKGAAAEHAQAKEQELEIIYLK
ncbi:DUF4406 domain-containing protein [Elusimicrobiota bacterium]